MISKARLKFLRSLRLKKIRAREGLLLAEGLHVVGEAVAGGRALEVWLTPGARKDLPGLVATEIGEAEAGALAQTRSPAGAFALVKDPCRRFDTGALPVAALVLLAAGVADPGNLGTLIRTSAALGADAVVVNAGSVEPTNPKTVRATAGALFRIPVFHGEAADLCEAGFEIWMADASGAPLNGSERSPARCALAVGNEPRGLDVGVRSLAGRCVGVPLARGVESLNVAVAAGILLRELMATR